MLSRTAAGIVCGRHPELRARPGQETRTSTQGTPSFHRNSDSGPLSLWGSFGEALRVSGRFGEALGERLGRLWRGFGELWAGFRSLRRGFGEALGRH